MLNHSLVPVGSTGYDIDNSLRFNDNDSAYLSRTPSVAGNQKTWTWSGWYKQGNLTVATLFSAGAYLYGTFFLINNGKLRFGRYSGGYSWLLDSTAIYRDPSAWYHIVVAFDTTQATASDRIKLYVNGELITDLNGDGVAPVYPALNYDGDMNAAALHRVGNRSGDSALHLDGYLAEVNFVDGQALTPSDFGETDETYGHWKPIAYAGTYGTNGFYLDFKNSGSLGNDASSNSNNWTPNNLAATDQMLDSPTNNFGTLNPLSKGAGATLYEGNTKLTWAASNNTTGFATGNFGMTSGKWYWEAITPNTAAIFLGITDIPIRTNTDGNSVNINNYSLYALDGDVLGKGGTSTIVTNYVANGTTSDVWGVAFDADTKKVWWHRNGTWGTNGSVGSPASGTFPALTSSELTGDTYFAFSGYTGGTPEKHVIYNFGQDSSFAGNKTAQGNADDNGYGDFYYTPPTGFLALCTQNLPEPTVVPSEHFNTVLWTGNGGTQSITGVGFSPDLVWGKGRSYGYGLGVFDKVRGATNALETYITDAEWTQSGVSSFDSDGFTLGSTWGNISGRTQVAWNWKANGAGVSNTNGSIASTVSANVDAGFSIVSWTVSGTAGSTIGHGLSSTPEMMIVKSRTQAGTSWVTYYGDNTDYLRLNSTVATIDAVEAWNDTSPTASVFSVGGNGSDTNNTNGGNMIGYMFHSVEGYSKVGSYTGNGSSDGTFVHCGFRPAYVMMKQTSTDDWGIYDSKRNGFNNDDSGNGVLYPNGTYAQQTQASRAIDLLSNGFKLRTSNVTFNENGNGDYIFIAFAENPFKYTNAR